MAKTEYVSFRRFAFAEPENKTFSSFNTLALGFGLRPWLSAYLFQPINVKAQEEIGRNAGVGDPNLMLVLGFKYDEGFRLVPEKESLDELMDWHMSVYASCSVPAGPTERKDGAGAPFAPDMQTGFGAPSPMIGVAVLKQLSGGVTWLADANYQHFFPHEYSFARYRFGGESRLGTAAAFRLFGSPSFRLDVVTELSGLHLQRDQESNAAGAMESLRSSGGTMLYGGAGLRSYVGPLSVAVAGKRAVLKSLNEQADQQGSEGLERFRLTLAVSFSTAL